MFLEHPASTVTSLPSSAWNEYYNTPFLQNNIWHFFFTFPKLPSQNPLVWFFEMIGWTKKEPNWILQHWVFTCMSVSLREYSVEKAGAGTSSPPTGDELSKTHSRDSTYRGSMQPQWCAVEANKRNRQSHRTEAKVYTILKKLALSDNSQSFAHFSRTKMLYSVQTWKAQINMSWEATKCML